MLPLQELITADGLHSRYTLEEICAKFTWEQRVEMARQLAAVRFAISQERALVMYRPVSAEARKFHLSTAQQRIILGGNGSSKSESSLADMVIRMTGLIPESLKADYPKEVLRPPISARLIVESLTNTWEQSIKPKLIWNHWTGLADGKRGHWGWIPKEFLIKGKWDESWSEKFRTLTLTNGSTLHVMSGDQDVTDFASASVHDIRVDEGKKHALWRENVMRLREGGSITMAMTPPDDESASWDAAWVYDELYEKGLPGPGKDPDIEAFTLFTEHNPYIAPDFIAKVGKNLTPEQREVRFHGRFMHLGGRIYSTFTERDQMWCFGCNKISFAVMSEKQHCGTCGGDNLVSFCHVVEPFERAYKWPCIFIVDPHPRKPVMCAWVAIDPADDWWQIAELQVDGTPEEIRDKVFEIEKRFDLYVAKRIIDPNMAESQAHNAGRRHITVRDEYDAVGLRCALADDNFHTGKDRIKNMLKPDGKTRRPRLHIFRTCRTSISQFLKFSWDEWARFTSDVRDPKAKPKDKDNDYPVMMGYLGNDNPSYAAYHQGYSASRPKRKRTGTY